MLIDTYRLCRYFAKYAAVAEYREKYEQITRFKKKFKNYVNVKLLSAPNFPNKFLFSRKFEQFSSCESVGDRIKLVHQALASKEEFRNVTGLFINKGPKPDNKDRSKKSQNNY